MYVLPCVYSSAYTGYLKLLLVGGEPSPAVMRPLVYHSDRRSELVMLWCALRAALGWWEMAGAAEALAGALAGAEGSWSTF